MFRITLLCKLVVLHILKLAEHVQKSVAVFRVLVRQLDFTLPIAFVHLVKF